MRPVELRLRGLHSFREEQVLDFTAVTGAGVFGIFGPTGSGKSTVLDAITLALYGRVERAPSGTQGILNHAEKRVEVAFTFDLAGSGGPCRYRAERSYARAGDGGLRTAACRLVEIGPGGAVTVLADKEREVTRRVVDLLGLTVEDFTRAVVLPQGRFAEFLHLAGAERRRMLQRLFGLERYGDRLAEQVKLRLERTDRELEGILREQQGLGDASPRALAEAGAALREALARAARAQEARAAVQTEHDRWREVWGWQQELAATGEAQAAFAAREPEILRAEAELEAAARAEQVWPYLEEAEAAEAAGKEARERLDRATREREAAGEEARRADATLEAARAERAREEPRLREQQVRLRDALVLEAELDRLRGERERAGRELEAAVRSVEEAAAQVAAAEAALAEVRRRQQETAARLDAVQVDPDRRARIQAALQALVDHRRALADVAARRSQLAAAREELARIEVRAGDAFRVREEAEETLRAAEAALAAAEADPHESDADLTQAARWLERVRGLVAEFGRAVGALGRARAEHERLAAEAGRARTAHADALARLEAAEAGLAGAERGYRAAQEALDAVRRQDMAAHLAARLEPGAPCPVCGGTRHPAPARAADPEALREAEGRLAEADARRVRAQAEADAARRAEAAAREALAAAERVLEDGGRRLGEAAEAVAAAAAALPAPWRGVAPPDATAPPGPALPDPSALADRLATEERELARRQEVLAGWKATVETRRAAVQQALARLREAGDLVAGRRAELAAARARVQSAEEALQVAEAEATARAGALSAARGDVAEEAIEAEAASIARRDREAQVLSRQLTELTGRIEVADRALREAQGRLEDRRREEADRRLAHERSARAEQEMAGRLAGITGGRPAAVLLTEVEAGIAALEQGEAAARSAAEAARERLEAAGRAESAARRETELAGERERAAATRLAEALAAAGFGSPEEVQAARRPAAAREDLRRKVEAHREEDRRLVQERQRLEELLAGRRLSDTDWAALQERLAAAQAEDDAARQALGAARRDHDEVQRRHARWAELEAQREALARLRGHLADLQGVLRGGAFVEFLGEEQLRGVALAASARLGQLTRYRYALEVDSGGGFRIRDDWSGGTRRPVTSLSGGETFLTSLSLALALSAQIQLRGRYPLEFFFLDEGFGTLDPELLETVIGALERLQLENVNIGVISHVPELRARLRRRVVVDPAEPGGRGSRLRVEMA